MNSYKKLVNNSIVFAIGNLGTKLIGFFLIPIYTFYLTKSEFGTVDLLTTTLSLLIPMFTLSIFDSVLRFAMDKNYDKQAVLVNSLTVALIGFAISFIIYPILLIYSPFGNITLYFYALLFVQSINTILTQYIRAIGMVRLFAVNGMINALALLVCNVIFLIIFHMGIEGYIISLIISNIVSSLLVTIFGKIKEDFVLNKVDSGLAKEMIIYSVPLIPNALMWWIMGLSDRYVITYFLGLSANGMYAVANKIPSILNMINSIFFQAWQMSAIEESDSKDKSEFFSRVFSFFSVAMLLSTSLLIILLKLIIDVLAADDYFSSWRYVPFLLLGVIFSSFSGFLGTNYIAAKKTSGVFKTSVIGACINLILNIVLVPKIGINGASIATMVSFAVIWLLRVRDTKQFVEIKIKKLKLILSFATIGAQIFYLYDNVSLNYYLLQIALFLIVALINLEEVKYLWFFSIKKIRNRKR